jgi:hypothetical protein
VPSRRATWSDVSQALAAGRTHDAEIALGDLAAHGDTSTQAKARLGIAQLALARGERGRAASIAREVEAMPGIEPAIAARASEIIGRTPRP